jgi:anti-sigma-K factor RskA
VARNAAGEIQEPAMNGWRLVIVAASAIAALAVGLGAQAGPHGDEIQSLLTAVSTPAR